MATSDKHCQTFNIKSGKIIDISSDHEQVMYDETITVVNAREIDSPSSGEESNLGANMSKFNPPARHTSRHTFSDSESESDQELFIKPPSADKKVKIITSLFNRYGI